MFTTLVLFFMWGIVNFLATIWTGTMVAVERDSSWFAWFFGFLLCVSSWSFWLHVGNGLFG